MVFNIGASQGLANPNIQNKTTAANVAMQQAKRVAGARPKPGGSGFDIASAYNDAAASAREAAKQIFSSIVEVFNHYLRIENGFDPKIYDI